MKRSACEITDGDLIAYADGELREGRREHVEAHLAACPICRRQLADFREVDRILREEPPWGGEPIGKAALLARLAGQTRRPRRAHRSRQIGVVAVVLLLALAVSQLVPGESRAGWQRFFRIAAPAGPATRLDGQEPPGTPITGLQPTGSFADVRFPAARPPSLPPDLTLAEQSIPAADRLELLYRAPDGMHIRVVQHPTRGIAAPPDDLHVFSVGATSVFWVQGALPGTVSALLWEYRGIAFDLLVVQRPPRGLTLAEAQQFVAALNAAQDGVR